MTQVAFDSSLIRKYSLQNNIPIADLIVKTLKEIERETGDKRTLIAVCPNSQAVLKASLMAAKEANSPIKFAATLNQVDIDKGYTGWTQESFVNEVARISQEIGFDGPIIIAVDHGGPWLKDLHSTSNWSYENTMELLKISFAAALFAGYDLVHIDPTVDKTVKNNETISIDRVLKRTLELIKYTESIRRLNNLHKISYEVGTEEVHGGLADMKAFDFFLAGLKDGLLRMGIGDIWPIFVVGKVGTDLHTTTFDSDVARELVIAAEKYGSYIKGHYTDFVSNPEAYPHTGIGAANIGPEFTESEYNALMELVKMEEELASKGMIDLPSRFGHVLKQAVIESGRWLKWRKGDEFCKSFEYYEQDRQEWLIKTGCRYIWTKPEVINGKKILFNNLAAFNINAEEFVLDKIKSSIIKYFKLFNLIDSINIIEDRLELRN